MKRKITAIFLVVALVLSFGLLPAAPVGASNGSPAWVLIETLTVNALNVPVVTSTNTLLDGWSYRIEASGTYSAGGPYQADAEYSTNNGWTTWPDSVPGYEGYGEGLLELKVDGSFVEWGAYNSGHVYTIDYVGTGSTVSFQIYDLGGGTNNSGSLLVKIYATPVMVTTAIISGESTVGVGAEESWDIEITVEAKYADVCDVVVQDGMGADLDEIVLGTPTQGSATSAKKGKGKMGATMVTWDVGDLAEDASATLVVTVTTGFNAKGKHSFTSIDTDHELDGGASATYTLCDTTVYKSLESDPLTVDVLDATVLTLHEKTGVPDWDIVPGGAWGYMTYNLSGSTFNYAFSATGLKQANTSYSLIYYPEPQTTWPHPVTVIDNSGMSDGSGNLSLTGSYEFGADLNNAKIWLVLSGDIVGGSLSGWQPTEYLFEHNLITYYNK